MKLIAMEKEAIGAAAPHFQPHLQAEAIRVWELYQAGIIREIYFQADRTEAVLVLECESVEEARGVLASLPLVKEGLISFDLLPLRPYDGFSRLFATEAPPALTT